MTLQEAIKQRHSMRRYVHKPLSVEIVETLQKKIEECNADTTPIQRQISCNI